MKSREKRIEKALGLFSKPSPEQMELARESVLQRLESSSGDGSQEMSLQFAPARFAWKRWSALAAVAAAIAIAAVLVLRSSAPAVLETADGSSRIAYGEVIRANGTANATLTLRDGSRVEMRAPSELSLERAADGIRIRLSRGVIIVNAAKQRTGHLYVQTHDLTVAVVGTVFLVNAEEEGSRVAVIEGEVRVERGAATKNLMTGDQLSTNPQMKSLPVKEEVSWSRNAEAHVALLAQATAAATAAPKRLTFNVVSIRPTASDAEFSASLGFACHGSDGMTRLAFRGRGPLIIAPQGRCVGNGVTLARLMNYAYGTPWRYGSRVPDWARTNGTLEQNPDVFQIEAVADDPASTTIAQLKQMLQAMLTDRFDLRIHRETQDVPGYGFRVAKSGLKLKEVAPGEAEPPVFSRGIKGKSSLDDLAQFMTEFLIEFNNLGSLDMPIVNRTGLMGIYNYEFRLRPSGGVTRGGDPSNGPPPREQRMADAIADINAVIEDQLGLRLQSERVSYEMIVIDQVEKPSPN